MALSWNNNTHFPDIRPSSNTTEIPLAVTFLSTLPPHPMLDPRACSSMGEKRSAEL